MINILRGYFLMIVYALDLYPEENKAIVNQRKSACSECPLRAGSFCSNRKAVTLTEYPFKGIFRKSVTNIVKGCGCFLPAKRLTNSKCPLNRWKKNNKK